MDKFHKPCSDAFKLYSQPNFTNHSQPNYVLMPFQSRRLQMDKSPASTVSTNQNTNTRLETAIPMARFSIGEDDEDAPIAFKRARVNEPASQSQPPVVAGEDEEVEELIPVEDVESDSQSSDEEEEDDEEDESEAEAVEEEDDDEEEDAGSEEEGVQYMWASWAGFKPVFGKSQSDFNPFKTNLSRGEGNLG